MSSVAKVKAGDGSGGATADAPASADGAARQRLPNGGSGIDRGRAIGFHFNGKRYTGYAGDTLASALLANGVTLVARSWKYHRPRGIVAAGVEEPNALVQLERGAHTVPNARATEVELYEGLWGDQRQLLAGA